MSGHTQGPWLATERSGYREILARHEGDWYGRKLSHAVAYVDTELEEAEQDANARLIAAAPAMLEALVALVDSFEKHRPKELWDNARAAIAAATGKTP